MNSALLQEHPVLIKPVEQDQRANEREACAKFKSEFLHFSFSAKMERVSDRRKITGHLFTSDVSDRGHAHAPRIPSAFDHVARASCSPGFPRTFYDATSRRNLAGNAIIIARSLIQRAYSLRSRKIENPTTDRTEALPGIVGLSVFRFGPHEKQHHMRSLDCSSIAKGQIVQ